VFEKLDADVVCPHSLTLKERGRRLTPRRLFYRLHRRRRRLHGSWLLIGVRCFIERERRAGNDIVSGSFETGVFLFMDDSKS